MASQQKHTVPEKTEGYATTFYPVRWRPYKPTSQQFKRGQKGRWQRMTEYGGWENCETPSAIHDEPFDADLAQALVAAAYEDAARVVDEHYASGDMGNPGHWAHSRTPDDAKAALERMLAEARRDGMERAAQIVDSAGYYCVPPYDETGNLAEQIDHSVDAIRAEMEAGDE